MGVVHLISGNDEFAVKNKAAEIIRGLCGDNPEENQSLEIVRGDDDSMKSDAVVSELVQCVDTPPFLSPDKTVWLKNYSYFDGDTKRDTAAMEKLTELIKKGVPDDVTLVISGSGVDRRKSFYKECEKRGAKITFLEKAEIGSKNYASTIMQRVRDICSEAGKYPAPDALQFLSESLGGDSGNILNEMGKLISYVGSRENITLEDCKEVASPTPETLSWAFAEALTERNTRKALDTIGVMMEQMRRERGNSNYELAILSNASRVFQEMVRTKAAAAELGMRKVDKGFFYNLSPAVKEKHPGNYLLGLNPYRAYMLCLGASRFSDKDLSEALTAILQTNKALVSGGANSRIALEQLVLKVAAPRSQG